MSPLGWLNRDHRKCLIVDGEVAFVTGLCVGQRWEGDPRRGIRAWRDTGVEVRGPAVADVARAFADTWAACGEPLPAEEQAGDLARRAKCHCASSRGRRAPRACSGSTSWWRRSRAAGSG